MIGWDPKNRSGTFFLPVSGDPREVTEYKHQQMFVLGDLPRVAWHGKEEGATSVFNGHSLMACHC